MIEGHDILCFAPGPWNDIWRNRHQIMTRLALANRVLYVEPWPQLRPTLRELRARHIGLADLSGPTLQRVDDNMYVYRPPLWAPRAARFPMDLATRAIYMLFIKRVLTRLHFRAPILWLFLPDMEVFVGRFGEKLLIYHIVDEYTGYSGVSEGWRPVMREMEANLAATADLVFVSSSELMETKGPLNKNVYLIPNAVDFAAFDRALDGAPVPDEIAHLPRPILGYIGAINEKLDLGLLGEVAQAYSEGSLVLVGPVRINGQPDRAALAYLQHMPNVYFLGRKDVTLVPSYIAACNVCLLPYRVNEWTRHIDSLKLYEYLACGKPIVSTGVPAARRLSDVVTVADSPADFVAGIVTAFRADQPGLRARRRQVAADNTWDQRVDAVSLAIERRLSERRTSLAARHGRGGE